MDVLRKKILLKRQVAFLIMAIVPIILVSILTNRIYWVWGLLAPSIALLFYQKRIISYGVALSMGDPRAENYSWENGHWAKFFWGFNFLFLFGVGDIIQLDVLVIILYFVGYSLFQVNSYKLIFTN